MKGEWIMKKLIITVMLLRAASVKKYFIMVVIGLLGIVSVIKAQNVPWTAKCPLPERNTWFASCTLDGKIYVIGGATDLNVLSAVEVYDPVTDTWDTTKANMSGSRWGLSANVVDGKIYAIGGVEGASGPALSKVEVYDPDKDTWEMKAEMPTRRVGFASCVVDNKIYILGGAVSEPFQTPLKTIEVYDPRADSWDTLKTSLPNAIAYHTACVVDGKIYLIGGTSQSPWTGSAEIEEYDPASDKWTRKKDMPTGRWALTSCTENGKIYVIGGTRSPGSGGSSKVEEYDPATDTWKTKAEMPTRRLALSASVAEGKIYAFGGAIVSYPWIPSVAIVEEYDPSLDHLTNVENPSIVQNPNQFLLFQNYPNPFSTTTTIEYNLPKSGNVNISIYNLSGERIRVLINSFQNAGSYEIRWNGKDDSGNSFPEGIYILELSLNDYKQFKNMILIK
jgi:N-acetylneuraminic acid mutarotase